MPPGSFLGDVFLAFVLLEGSPGQTWDMERLQLFGVPPGRAEGVGKRGLAQNAAPVITTRNGWIFVIFFCSVKTYLLDIYLPRV